MILFLKNISNFSSIHYYFPSLKISGIFFLLSELIFYLIYPVQARSKYFTLCTISCYSAASADWKTLIRSTSRIEHIFSLLLRNHNCCKGFLISMWGFFSAWSLNVSQNISHRGEAYIIWKKILFKSSAYRIRFGCRWIHIGFRLQLYPMILGFHSKVTIGLDTLQ